MPYLDADDLLTLNVGDSADGGAIAVVAPGTGLGQAFLTWDGHRYRAHPSEGGHTDFAPLTERQAGLLRFLQGQYDHVSYERVCSGLGIPNLYQFVRDSDPTSEPADLAAVLAKADDRTPLIVQRALADSDPTTLCRQTMSLFIEILAAAASNLALSTLATGGVYLGGGIPPRILPLLTPATFLPAFQNKGRFRDLCERMPVHVILNPQAALLGASYAVNTDLAHYDGEERGAGRRPS